MDQLARVDALAPDVEMTLLGEPAHRLAVLPYAVGHDPSPPISWKADVAARDLGARRHPLDVPLPRAGQRLIEIVRTEYQVAILRREATEVRDVSVALRGPARPTRPPAVWRPVALRPDRRARRGRRRDRPLCSSALGD